MRYKVDLQFGNIKITRYADAFNSEDALNKLKLTKEELSHIISVDIVRTTFKEFLIEIIKGPAFWMIIALILFLILMYTT